MADRPKENRKRGDHDLQDSGVGSFGSESDSSPVQMSVGTVTGSTAESETHTINSLSTSSTTTSVKMTSPSKMSKSFVQHSGNHCSTDQVTGTGQTDVRKEFHKPTISIIPQSPPLCQTQQFIYGNSIAQKSVTDSNENMTPLKESKYHVTYYGESVLDRRYTRPMLPWIMAEIRRNSSKHEITLEILPAKHVLQATERGGTKIIFQHKLPTVSSFARAHQDPTCFVYLTRFNVDSPFICHVFQVSEESKVPRLFSAIRDATKEAVREAHHHVHTPDGAGEPTMVANSHLCEVMYVGKVVVTSKKAPPTFIDEAVDKFREHDRLKCDVGDERRRHSSGNSVQSLPADLEQTISVRENDIGNQASKDKGSNDSYINLSEEDVADSIPLGGSSNTFLLNQALKNVKRQRKLSLQESDMSPPSNSHDSMKNPLTQHIGQGEGHGMRSDMLDHDNLQKYVLQSQSQVKKNRTMLLQVGQNDVSLISTDKKKVIFERKFTDISFCSQGIQHPEHFGFISRDLVNNNMFMCYVFRCATEALVEEVMQTLKQAFHTAYQQSSKNHVVCELCPMHQLHKLCQEIDKQSPDKVHEILIHKIEQLNEKDRTEILEEYQKSTGEGLQEKNELLMSILRHVSEDKQDQHFHISDTNKAKQEFVLVDTDSSSHGNQHSKFDQFRTKAKKSLTTSFENILHRMPKKDERRENFKQAKTWTTESESSINSHHSLESSWGNTPETTPMSSPMVKEFIEQFPTPFLEHTPRPVRSRSYSATSTPTQEMLALRERQAHHANLQHSYHSDKVRGDIVRLFGDTSPLKSMFHRVTSSMHHSSSPRSPSPTRGYPGAMMSPFGKGSWRMDILSRVVTPSKPARSGATRDRHRSGDECDSISEEVKNRKIRWRHLWRKAILETLLLIRMEKENKTLKGIHTYSARQDEVETRRIKLDYEEITPCLKEVTKVWDRMLNNPIRSIDKLDLSKLYQAVKDGVPRAKRGEIWQLQVQQHRLHNPQLIMRTEDPIPEPAYDDLLKQLTTHQHAILIDLGRTFPGHPYFANPLGQGQLALFNILKAYSLIDQEVGYCQGLSFVAGILLMHMPEDTAFHTMKYTMLQLGFRRQYRPDMVALQIQLYQLSRLLHDCHRDLYEHLEKHEIAPTLYAAPWFLTIFASQFPLGFVARVFDLIFLQGMEVVFKVALVLLGNHKELIKQCNSFESIMEFLKTTLPSMGIIQMERVINQVFQMDLSKDLYGYEIEYHVLQEEMQKTPNRGEDDVISRLEQANHNLKRQNLELLEQLQSSRSQSHSFELQLHNVHSNQNKLKSHIRTLELERAALLNAVSKLRKLVPEEVLEDSNVNIPALNADKTITNSPIHNPLVNRFLEEMDVKFTSSSLTEFDREVAELMAAKHRKLSDQGQNKNMRLPADGKSNEFLSVDSARNERPASSNY